MDSKSLSIDREIIEKLFSARYAIEHHMGAPLFAQRAAYLRYLEERGMHRKTLKDTAALLNQAARVLRLEEPRFVNELDIREAAAIWSKEVISRRSVNPKKSAERFYTAANGFLQFHKLKVKSEPYACCFDLIYSRFYDSLLQKGYLPTTLAAVGPPVRLFLFWLSTRIKDIGRVSWQDIQVYLDEGISSGWQPRTVLGKCQALRNFFRFAGQLGYCNASLHRSIVNPVVRSRDCEAFGPAWEDVRRMIRLTGLMSAQESRAKAILLLCAVYGLRSSEVRGLTLDAFDWKSESFTLKHAKNGYWQRFPITQELREVVTHYLVQHRPDSACRALFVTLRPPFRPLQNLGPIIKKRMRVAGVDAASFGPHSLRHSCATELLRQGTSLLNIANLLGHRDLRSVSVYARHDLKSLKMVASFNLDRFA